ncbi:MAG: glycoside hydrolase family 2 protein [Butyrivibrio sp.]|nr:glycoside hydrolase family 2 protein [Butyrivibrio sp.]
MSEKIYLNNNWKFSTEFKEKFLSKSSDYFLKDKEDKGIYSVRIPHSVAETPYNYFDEHIYQMESMYAKVLYGDEKWQGKKLFLTFEGAAHKMTLYLNGELIGDHSCGYTAYTIDITDKLKLGENNLILVKLDSRENLNVPPFGFVIDYMTYGGIYRDVYLEIKNNEYIEDVFTYTEVPAAFSPDTTSFEVKSSGAFLNIVSQVRGDSKGLHIKHYLRRYKENIDEKLEENVEDSFANETFLGEADVPDISGGDFNATYHLKPVVLWDVYNPALYILRSELYRGEQLIDVRENRFGFRRTEFMADGFYLNGRKFKIRGLNRHQSYPYVGYAMPKSMQVMDAEILKKELAVNAVRTSHYPQSQYFIDRCDEIGLLVFMEFPGWQHIGDEEWKKQAVINEEEMIRQYRNHPSIFIWGIRINESPDDDDFYTLTNQVARKLDPSRMTGGVRAHKKMNLLEDVYTYNDFSHDGVKPGCEPKSNVTPDKNKGYLITEYNGHMYPTKAFDNEENRAEHALRHIRVMDAVAGQKDISGSFGWCMFDYNTHEDFGSGDRICYHGVMDMYRNPKLAAAAYSSQSEDETYLEISSSMDIGEHPGCIRKDAWIFTNADSVKMYKNDVFIKEYKKENTKFKNLPHGPILIDDFVGNQIEENEDLPKNLAVKVEKIMNHIARNGMNNVPKRFYFTGARLLLINKKTPSELVTMFNKYVGDWGGKATEYKFEAIKNGAVIKTVIKRPVRKVNLEVIVSSTELHEKETYDVSAIWLRAIDEYGNVISYMNEPVWFKTEGPIEIIGPDRTAVRGGLGGAYIKTTGKSGKAKLIIKSSFAEKKEIEFDVHIDSEEEEIEGKI